MTPELSVVLPCYRSASLAIRSVERLAAYLGGTGLSWEVIVVDDGGGDFPNDPWNPDGSARLIRLPINCGKGAAVGAGMRAARGWVRIFTDVDLPYDLTLLPVMAQYIRERGFHVVIGDRTLPGSSYHGEISTARRLASLVFSEFVGRLVTGGFFDTQCGLKALRGDVADALFGLRRLDRFAFDVELVYLSLRHKLDIKRIPVQLRNNETSTVRVGRDALRGVVDVLRIKYHQLRGHYESRELAALIRDEFLADSRHELDSRTAPARAPSVPVLASALFMPSPPTGASADLNGGAM
jgi:dolichyl-phosphate beta-glucosyltransferase